MSATPVIESGADRGDGRRFRAAHGLAADDLLITVLPGSRGGEVRRLLPIFGSALRAFGAHARPFSCRRTDRWNGFGDGRRAVRAWPGEAIIVQQPEVKYDAFAASRVALAASGSVALELALAKLPMVVALPAQPADRGRSRTGREGATGKSRQPAARRAAGPRAVGAKLHARAARRCRSPSSSTTNGFAQRTGGGMMRLFGVSRGMDCRRACGPPTRSSRSSPRAGAAFRISTARRERNMTMTDVAETAKTVPGAEKFRLLHTMIRVRDLDASLNFYTEPPRHEGAAQTRLSRPESSPWPLSDMATRPTIP